MSARSASFLAASLRSGRSVWATISGRSMWPALSAGSRIRIDPVPAGYRPVPGDVVAVLRPAGIVVHRVVAAAAGRIATWGDGATSGDASVDVRDVVGRLLGAKDRIR